MSFILGVSDNVGVFGRFQVDQLLAQSAVAALSFTIPNGSNAAAEKQKGRESEGGYDDLFFHSGDAEPAGIFCKGKKLTSKTIQISRVTTSTNSL